MNKREANGNFPGWTRSGRQVAAYFLDPPGVRVISAMVGVYAAEQRDFIVL